MNDLKVEEYSRYLHWKGWSREAFGQCSPGNRFCFEQQFEGLLKPDSRILEVGFGNGELLGFLKGRGRHVVGVEINEELVKRAIDRGFTAYYGHPWEIADLQTEKFDLVVGMAVAEHMDYACLIKFFKWVSANLRESGVLFLKFPEGSSPIALGYQNGDFTHISCLTITKIEALCELSGMGLAAYIDDQLVSNTLCSLGPVGRFALVCLQLYARLLKLLIRMLFFPLNPRLNLATNSIALIKPLKRI